MAEAQYKPVLNFGALDRDAYGLWQLGEGWQFRDSIYHPYGFSILFRGWPVDELVAMHAQDQEILDLATAAVEVGSADDR